MSLSVSFKQETDVLFTLKTEMLTLFRRCVCMLLFLLRFSEAVISCLNEDGQPVDW